MFLIIWHKNRTICIIGGDTINWAKLQPCRCPNWWPVLPKLLLSHPDNVTYTLMADVEKHEIWYNSEAGRANVIATNVENEGARAEQRKSSDACRVQISVLVCGSTNALDCWWWDTFPPHWHMSVCKQVYIYMSIPFNAHCNDQTHSNWQLWGASMPITLTIIADQSLITLKHSPCHPTAYHVTKIPFMAKPPYSTTPGYQSNLNICVLGYWLFTWSQPLHISIIHYPRPLVTQTACYYHHFISSDTEDSSLRNHVSPDVLV